MVPLEIWNLELIRLHHLSGGCTFASPHKGTWPLTSPGCIHASGCWERLQHFLTGAKHQFALEGWLELTHHQNRPSWKYHDAETWFSWPQCRQEARWSPVAALADWFPPTNIYLQLHPTRPRNDRELHLGGPIIIPPSQTLRHILRKGLRLSKCQRDWRLNLSTL